MKRFIKQNSRKGFTLVETILATFILFVVSTMLVNGFIAAIGYSYQTSIYNKSSGDNYAVCMQDIGTWSKKSKSQREIDAQDYTSPSGTGGKSTLSFTTSSVYGGKSLESLNVIYEKHDSIRTNVIPDGVAFTDGRFAPTSNTDQRADNRKSFCYYPEHCVDKDGNHKGEIIVMYVSSEKKYYWTVNDGQYKKDSVSPTPIG
jgi:hypothetical protein